MPQACDSPKPRGGGLPSKFQVYLKKSSKLPFRYDVVSGKEEVGPQVGPLKNLVSEVIQAGV